MTVERKEGSILYPLKIYISADMEGIGGLVDWKQDEALFCRLMTAEVNAAIEGAFEAGATEVVVNDAHNDGKNILIESIDPRATLIQGSPRPLAMMQGIDQSFDAVFFVGYHARAGTPNGIMAHTWTGWIQDVMVNREQFGETELNSALAGHFGVPVALLTGDAAVIEQAGRVVTGGQTVISKYGVNRYSGKLLPPSVVTEKIRTAAASAVLQIGKLRPFVVETPVEIRVAFDRTIQADAASIMPGITRMDPVSVAYSAVDYFTAYQAFISMIRMASGA